ncbi:MAG: hypothetical protein ABEI52_11945, partial [Halobacteriaceae archaeon]
LDDRIVIVDEDPGDAFQTRFNATELHQVIREYLEGNDAIPVSNLDSIKLLRQDKKAFEEARKEVLDHLEGEDRLTLSTRVLRNGEGHVDAGYAIQTLLAATEDADHFGGGPRREVLDNGVEFARLDGSVVGAYDPVSGELAIRRTPRFQSAAAVVGLDGTPIIELWRGRLGLDNLERVRVLCDECRQTYLQDVLGYQIIQTSPYIKPYSGATAERVSFDKDRGLLHEVSQRSDGRVGLITTKQVKEELLNREDGNDVPIPREAVGHFQNIRGSNEFAGDEIQYGVVVGSPNPGPDELRLLAGLSGDAFATEKVVKDGGSHQYRRREPTREAEPY